MTKKESEKSTDVAIKAKKTNNKITVKKPAAKKIVKSNSDKEIKSIKPENYFFLNDGRVLKDLFELAECLETIDNNTFFHHVNDGKNDFSNWIRDVFNDKDLAEEIYVLRDPKQMHLIIFKNIAKKKRG